MKKLLFRRNLRAFFLCIIFSLSGIHEIISQTADFSVNKQIGCNRLFAIFKDESTGATSWFWDLGNNNTSIKQNPQAIYNKPGKYTVSLTINGGADKMEKKDYIIVVKPEAKIEVESAAGCNPKTVKFIDKSTTTHGNIVSWIWLFGDGSISMEQHPTHIYNLAGSFDVNLLITDDNGCENDNDYNFEPATIDVFNNPVADFVVDEPTGCQYPHEVNFVNTTSIPGTPNVDEVITGWQWDFGDGHSSTEKNPTHIYENTGSYSVTLKADGGDCSDEIKKTDIVIVYNNSLDFDADKKKVCLGETVRFSDLSTNVKTWKWYFGDGHTSNQQNPQHVYDSEGLFTVRLDVEFNNGCESTLTKEELIEVSKPPVADFNADETFSYGSELEVQFTNLSLDADSYLWDFGDGNTSTEENPVHVFSGFGMFTVSLNAINGICEDVIVKEEYIELRQPDMNIKASKYKGCVPLEVDFRLEGDAKDEIASYFWTFGDGNSSTATEPTHTYLVPGTYEVRVEYTLTNGNVFSESKPDFIQCGDKKIVEFEISQGDSCYSEGAVLRNLTQGVDSLSWFCAGMNYFTKIVSPSDNSFKQTCFSHINHHDVTLEVWDRGCKSVKTVQDLVYIKAPIARFSLNGFGWKCYDFSANYCEKPATVMIYNESEGVDNYHWEMGEGTVFDSPPSTFRYDNTGDYRIKCTAENTTTGCVHEDGSDVHVHETFPDFTADKTEGCYPLTVQLRDNSTTSGRIVYYTWDIRMRDYPGWIPDWWMNDGYSRDTTIYGENPRFNFKYPGKYDITLTVHEYWGCVEKEQKSAFIHVFDSPHVHFDIDRPHACEDEEIQFTDRSTAENAINTREWNLAGTIVNNETNVSHTFSGTGIKFVSLYVEDIKGCHSSSTETVTIESPSAQFDAREKGCRETGIQFFNYSAGKGLSCDWQFGDGNSSSAYHPVHAYSASGTFDVSLTVTDMYGCRDDAPGHEIEIIEPVADFDVSETDLGCASMAPPVDFYNQSSSDIVAWEYDFGTGAVSNLAEPSYKYPPGDWDVTLTVTSSTGCQRSITKPDFIHVEGPVGSISTDGANGCIPFEVQFTATTSDVQSIKWDFGDGSVLSDDFSPTHTYTSSWFYTPKISLIDQSGCEFGYDGQPITVAEAPQVDFTAQTNNLCEKNEVTFTNLTTLQASPVESEIESFYWTFGQGQTSTEEHPTITYDNYGDYDVTLTATTTRGCNSTLNKPLYISVFKSTTSTDFNISNDYICPWEVVIFTDNTDTDDEIDSWEWDFGDGHTSVAQNPSHRFSGDDNRYDVHLKVSNKDGCWDTITKYIDVNSIKADFEAQPVSGSNTLQSHFIDKTVSDEALEAWTWDFGDGEFSGHQHPVHTFQGDGTDKKYDVSLIAENESGCLDTALKQNYIFPYNQQVVAQNDTFHVPEDKQIVELLNLNDYDPDGQVLIYSYITGQSPKHGKISIRESGKFIYTPFPGFYGIDSCDYQVCDNGEPATCDEATVYFYVDTVNDPTPVAKLDLYTIYEDDTLLAESVFRNDLDYEALGFDTELMSETSNGEIIFHPDGTFNYVPEQNYNGEDRFVYKVCDRGTPVECASAEVIIEIIPVHYPPDAVNDSVVLLEDEKFHVKPLENDSDADDDIDPQSFRVTDKPNHGTIEMSGESEFYYYPEKDFSGVDILSYKISDEQGNSDIAQVHLTIVNVEDPPVAKDDIILSLPGRMTSCFVLLNDYDVDENLNNGSLRVILNPSTGKIQGIDDGVISYISPGDFLGKDEFRYEISDMTGLKDTGIVSIDVTNDIPMPDARDDKFSTNEGSDITFNILTNDRILHFPTCQAEIISFPQNGELTAGDEKGVFTYDPAPDYFGTEQFLYTLTDHVGQVDTATIEIRVINTPDSPVALDDSAMIFMNTPTFVEVLLNDHDIDNDLDSSSVKIVSQEDSCEISIYRKGKLLLTPGEDFSGWFHFQYSVADTNGLRDKANVKIFITDDIPAPVAMNDTVRLNEDEEARFTVTHNDTVFTGNRPYILVSAKPGNGDLREWFTFDEQLGRLNSDKFVYIPAKDFSGTDVMSYVYHDPAGLSDTARVYFIVSDVPDQPDANNDTVNVLQNKPMYALYLLNDTDPDNDIDSSATTILHPASHGNVSIDFETDRILYQPDSGFIGDDECIYKIYDSEGLSDSAYVIFNVLKTIFDPQAKDDHAETTEDTPISISVRDNDTIFSGNQPSFRVTTSPEFGTLILKEPGHFIYQPDTNFYGEDIFHYNLIDPVGLEDSARVNITVTPVNDKPVALNDTVEIVMNLSVEKDILANDYDVDNNMLIGKTQILTPPQNINVELMPDYSLFIKPFENFTGIDSLKYGIEDEPGLKDTAKVIIHIVEPEKPTAINDSVTLHEDSLISVSVLKNDTLPANEESYLHMFKEPHHGVVTTDSDSVSFTYQPDDHYFGVDTFDYYVITESGLTDTARVYITVINVGDTIIANDDYYSAYPFHIINCDVLENDFDYDDDIDTSSLSVFTAPEHGDIISGESGVLLYEPDMNFIGKDSLTYKVSDTSGLTAKAMVFIEILPPVKPVAVDDDIFTTEDHYVDFDILENDTIPAGDTAYISLLSEPLFGMLDTNNVKGKCTYHPDEHYFGTDSFLYVLHAQSGLTDTALVTIHTESVEDPPFALTDTVYTRQGHAVDFNVLINDYDVENNMDTSSVITGQIPHHGEMKLLNGGRMWYKPDMGFTGKDSLLYLISDYQGKTGTGRVLIFVLPAEPPVAMDDNFVLREDMSLNENFGKNDTVPVEDTSYVSVHMNPQYGQLELTDNKGAFYYIPNENNTTTDFFIYVLHAESGLRDTATVSVNFQAVNDPPVANDDSYVAESDILTRMTPADNDLDVEDELDMSSLSVITGPQHGKILVLDNGSVSYVSESGFTGDDSFSYSICDKQNLCDEALVSVSVIKNKPPVALNDTLETEEDTELYIPVEHLLSNDRDEKFDTSSVSVVDGVGYGSLEIVDNGYVYLPDNDFYGEDYFIYKACDHLSQCDQARVLITVHPVPDPPKLISDSTVVPTNQATVIPVDISDLFDDPEDDIDDTNITIVTPPGSGGEVYSDSLGNIIFDYGNVPGFSGEDSVTVDICDYDGNCSRQTIRISVESVTNFLFAEKALSPNNDGINDYLAFEHLEEYPDNRIIIFNRWGTEVFRKSNYDNSWQGKSRNGRTNLPDGTYYYLLFYHKKQNPVKGYIYLKAR
jgi:gliding motility-associated-like protein